MARGERRGGGVTRGEARREKGGKERASHSPTIKTDYIKHRYRNGHSAIVCISYCVHINTLCYYFIEVCHPH